MIHTTTRWGLSIALGIFLALVGAVVFQSITGVGTTPATTIPHRYPYSLAKRLADRCGGHVTYEQHVFQINDCKRGMQP